MDAMHRECKILTLYVRVVLFVGPGAQSKVDSDRGYVRSAFDGRVDGVDLDVRFAGRKCWFAEGQDAVLLELLRHATLSLRGNLAARSENEEDGHASVESTRWEVHRDQWEVSPLPQLVTDFLRDFTYLFVE